MNLKDVEATLGAAAKKAGLLGTLFWWDLGNTRIDHASLIGQAKAAALDESLLPANVKPSTAFKRAWRAAARRAGDELLLRPIAETPEQVVVAVVREKPDVANLDLRYDVLARASFSKKTDAITLLEQHPILDELGALFAHYSAITTEDIRAMVLAFVRRAALSIRHAGGVYFIPPALSPTLEALCAVLKNIGPNTSWTLPIADIGSASESLAALAHETLDAEITAVEAELAAFDARDVEVRDSTLERRLKKFDELRSRTNLMAGALSFRADALLEKLITLEGDVKRKLLGEPLELPPPELDPFVKHDDDETFDAEVGF